MPDPSLVGTKRSVEDKFLGIGGVHSVGVGDGKIIVYAQPGSRVDSEIPMEVNGYPVEIKEQEPFTLDVAGVDDVPKHGGDWNDRHDEFRPVPIGVSVGTEGSANCTNAFLATDGDDYYTTTAGHCFPSRNEGTPVSQGSENVAQFHEAGPQGVDFAALKITGARHTNELLGLGSVLGGGAIDLEPGMTCWGVTTRSGLVEETIEAVDVTNTMVDGDKPVWVVTENAVTQGGDSGSAWVVQDDEGNYRPAGVHKGSGGMGSVFTDWQQIEQRTGFEVVSGNAFIGPDDTVGDEIYPERSSLAAPMAALGLAAVGYFYARND